MSGALRFLKWGAAGLVLVLGAAFGAFFFFVFEKEQQFWDELDRSRPGLRVRLEEVPAALRAGVRMTDGQGACSCLSAFRDLYRSMSTGRFEPGSCSLEWQVVRLVTSDLWQGSFSRLMGGQIAICNLASGLTREQILEEYLNRAYFGDGQYGVASAARFYFGKLPAELSMEESAALAGMLRKPAPLPVDRK